VTYATTDNPASLVERLVSEYRARGLKRPDAIEAVARWFGMKPRRVRMIRDMEVFRLRPDEHQSIAQGWERYLDHKAKNLQQQLEAIQARKASR
jgi:NADH:ubiquinone oxidoreductase subunit E